MDGLKTGVATSAVTSEVTDVPLSEPDAVIFDTDADGDEDVDTPAQGKVRIDSATSLWRAAEHGDVGRLKMLLDAGHDVNAREEHENRGECRHKTPLSAAVDGNEPLAVRLLLRRGANPDLQDGDGDRYPLHWASAFGDHDECCELLVQAGASLDARDKKGHTALEFARGSASGSVHGFARLGSTLLGRPAGRDRVIAVLEKAAARTDARAAWSADAAKRTLGGAYWKAAASGELKVLERCLSIGQPVDQPRPAPTSRMSALAISCYHGKAKAVALLLRHGADPDAPEAAGGYTPLHFCAHSADRPKCAEALLSANADPTKCKHDGESPYAFAARHKRPATAALLAAAAERHRAAAKLSTVLEGLEPTSQLWLSPSAAALADALAQARTAGVETALLERGAAALVQVGGAPEGASTSSWASWAVGWLGGGAGGGAGVAAERTGAPPSLVAPGAAVDAEAGEAGGAPVPVEMREVVGAAEAPMLPAPMDVTDEASLGGDEASLGELVVVEHHNATPAAAADAEASANTPPASADGAITSDGALEVPAAAINVSVQ